MSVDNESVKCVHTILFLCLIFFSSRVSSENCNDSVSAESLLVTHWPEEAAIRERMEEYAQEKLSHHYHWQNSERKLLTTTTSIPPTIYKNENDILKHNKLADITIKRRKRDLGLSTAILSGIIGMTSRAVSDLTSFHAVPSEGGCKWFGTAPFCNYHCPSDYDYIRGNNGRCSSLWFASTCMPDDSFGETCSTLLGSYFKKRFCCKSDPNECTWSGRWMGANTAHNAYCRYDNSVGRCGELSCSVNHYEHKANDRNTIGGDHCDELTLFNLTGRATCGYIAWFDLQNDLVNSWYKTNG